MGCYIVKYTLRDRSLRVSQVPRSIDREGGGGGRRTSSRTSIGSPLTTVQTLLVLSSSLVTVGRQKRRECRRSLFAAFFRDQWVMRVA